MSFLLIWSTLSCLFDSIAASLIQLVLSYCYHESQENKSIRKDMITLKDEMKRISMVDEFARHAKLQRKYIGLEDKAKANMNAIYASKIKWNLTLTYSFRIVNAILTSILMLLYRNEPVVLFPKGTLWPFESILSFPANADTCISLPAWILMMRLSITCINRS